MILGSSKPVVDTALSGMDGYTRYDSNLGLLQFATGGSYKTIPVHATTHVPKLSSTAALSDVVAKINELITVLADESKIIGY